MTEDTKRLVGFAKLTPEQRKAIASRGGKSVKPENRTFSRSNEKAVLAGKSGGRGRKNKTKDKIG